MAIEREDIFAVIRPSTERLRLLILHSTEDSLGKDTADAVGTHLAGLADWQIQSVNDYCELLKQLERVNSESFHVVLFLVHGDSQDNLMWLIKDRKTNGEDLGTSVGELLPSWKESTTDSLLLFGVCHFGMGEICAALRQNVAAVSAVAPKESISKGEIVVEFGKLLKELAENEEDVFASTVSEACNRLSSDFRKRIVVYAEDGSGDCP